LDVVPDNLAKIENAFSLRNTAENYLFTCYSWMPNQGSFTNNPGFLSADEMWTVPTNNSPGIIMARGLQNVVSPLFNYWDGGQGGSSLYEGIRDCNIFLENVGKVPDILESERNRWIAEVKFLKAYYHFWLMRAYGPIPIIKENLPISATTEEVRVTRDSVDDVVDYIISLLDEASSFLPLVIENPTSEAGRITKPVALSLKAYVYTVAASPLFNGNGQYSNMLSEQGQPLINQAFSVEKWQLAATACKEAIDASHSAGLSLYEFTPGISQFSISDTIKTQMSIRNSVAERWNSEAIWSNPNSLMNQAILTPRSWDPSRSHPGVSGGYAPPLKIVEIFYSENGVPIEEDTTYDYVNRYDLKTAGENDKFNIKKGYTTATLNFNRENRFYATLGFDGGVWYGQGRLDDNNPWHIFGKSGQAAAISVITAYSTTGYWPKKLINYNNVIENNSYSSTWYPWPVFRLADLYLLYAESENEANGPSAEVYEFINKVRERAGLEKVEDAWPLYSNVPDKHLNQNGLRDIIQQERMIELALEGQRYWDLKRWKRAHIELSKPITGWDVFQESEAGYYQETIIFEPVFRLRDYLWPISENSLLRNDRLIQNTGW